MIEIRSHWNGEVLFKSEKTTLREALLEALLHGADLSNANLDGADLSGADLSNADLSGADLDGADLSNADLSNADLSNANLDGADLSGADLSNADLSGADLSNADLSNADLSNANLNGAGLRGADLNGAGLRGADLNGASLPAPTMVLRAQWGLVSDQLTADLMLFDASCHPDPSAFDRWAMGGCCPYITVSVQRAALFREQRALWGKGQPCRPYDLMRRLLVECTKS